MEETYTDSANMNYFRSLLAALVIVIGIGAWDFIGVQAATPPLTSSQISSTTATTGYVLQTKGNANYWVATSTLGFSGGGGSGTVTQVNTTYPILGGSITNTGTLSLAFGTTTANTWSALQTFASGFVSQASSTISVLHLGIPLEVASGGTGSTTLTGILKGAGTSGIVTAIGDTDYQKPISLTTTGTSGVSTFIGDVLNIPNYANTTYTAAYPITLTGTTFGTAFGTTTNNVYSGTNTFNNGVTTNALSIGSLTGTLNVNNGTVYSTATSSVTNGTGISFTGTAGALIGGTSLTIANTGVLSDIAGTGISVSGATGNVTITNTIGYPFPSNATSTLLTLSNGATIGNPFTLSGLGTGELYTNSTGLVGTSATTTVSCSGSVSCSPFTTFGASPFTITGSGSGGTGLSTTSPIASSNLLEYSSVGAGSAFGIATNTLTASSPLTGSFTQIGSGGTLGCQTASGSQAGCLSSTDWTTFNNKSSSAYPFTSNSWGQSTTTTLGFLNGFVDTASTTFTSSPQFNSLFAQTINPDTSAADSFNFGGRPSVGIPVPYVRPTQSNQNIALDIFPNGTPGNGFGNSIYGAAWEDICSTDIFAGPNYECLHLGKAVGGASNISSSQGGNGNIQPLAFQLFGGNTGVGTSSPYAYFAIEASTTAGSSTEPLFAIASSSTDVIVTNGGLVGFGTSSPISELTVNGGVTLHGLATGAGAGAVCATADGLISYNGGAPCTGGGGSGTNYFTNLSSNTYLNIGSLLQAPTIEATSTTGTSVIDNILTVGTTSAATNSKLLFVEGNVSGGVARIQRDFPSAPINSKIGTYDVVLNETVAGSLANETGPAQTFGVEQGGGAENIYGDIAALRDGADTSGALVLDSYNAGVAAPGVWISHTQQVGIATSSFAANLSVAMTSTTPSFMVGVAGSTTPAFQIASANGNGAVSIGTTLNLSALTGTQCLQEISGVVSGTGSTCGSGGISTPVSIANGGTATSTGGVTNGVEYYNGTSLTNSSAMTWNGTNFSLKTANAEVDIYNTNDSSTKNGFFHVTYDSLQFGYVDTTNLLYVGKEFLGGNSIIATSHTNAVLDNTGLSNVLDDGSAFGRMGVGSTSPSAQFSIFVGGPSQTYSSLAPTELFDIGSSSAGKATTTLFAVFSTGKVGIGTSSPTATFVSEAASTTAGTTQTAYVGVVAMITGLENTTLKIFFEIDQWGHQITSGDTPTATGGTSSVSGNDNNGRITVTGTALTSVTLNFAHAWPSAPDCTESDNSTALTADITSISTTQMVVGFSIGVSSQTVWYQCVAHQ